MVMENYYFGKIDGAIPFMDVLCFQDADTLKIGSFIFYKTRCLLCLGSIYYKNYLQTGAKSNPFYRQVATRVATKNERLPEVGSHFVSVFLEATRRFELLNRGFADLRLNHLATSPHVFGAQGGTRTHTGNPTAPSSPRVYQFHHLGF